MRRFAAIAAAIIAAASVTVSASLGGSVSTVDLDRVQMRGALLRIAGGETYAVHEIQSGTGTVVREFVSPTGVVFGVAWQGPWMPDLRQLLGPSFDQYQKLRVANAERRRRGPIAIDTPDLSVRIGGHPRSFSGRAYLPRMVPQGVDVAAIR